MALRLKHRLYRHLLTRPSRYMSNKLDAVIVTNNTEEERPEILDEPSNNQIRYNVCRDRTTSSQKFVFEDKKSPNLSEEDKVETCLQNDEDMPQMNNPNQQNSPARGYRLFAASTTYKNVILPLKSSKLANPFPEPVKVMPSHTVSDQEKADQMQAECKVPRSITKTRAVN